MIFMSHLLLKQFYHWSGFADTLRYTCTSLIYWSHHVIHPYLCLANKLSLFIQIIFCLTSNDLWSYLGMLPTNKELQKSWASQIVGWILRGGEMPNHVAFIMDGNRRFARRKNEKVIKGHESGFHKLAQVLSWCEMLNIPEVTVYAFSAENFKRSQVRTDYILQYFCVGCFYLVKLPETRTYVILGRSK